MYCTNCGNKLADNSSKCGKCGHEVLLPGKAEFSSGSRNTNNKKRFRSIVIGIGAIIVTVLVASIVFKPAKPEQIGARFAQAIEQEKWADAYKYFNLEEAEDGDIIALVDKDNFSTSFSNISKRVGGVEKAEFDPQEELNEFQGNLIDVIGSPEEKSRYNPKRYWEGYFTIYWNGGYSEDATLPLINTGSKRPDWKISIEPFLETRTIDTLEGVQVKVEGHPLVSQDPQRKGCYQYKAFYNFEAKVHLSSENGDIAPLEFSMIDAHVNMMDLEPSAQTMEQLKNAALRYLKANSPIEDVGSRTEVYTFKEAWFDEDSFTFLDSINQAKMGVIETWEKSIQEPTGLEQDKAVLKYELIHEFARTDNGWEVVNQWDR